MKKKTFIQPFHLVFFSGSIWWLKVESLLATQFRDWENVKLNFKGQLNNSISKIAPFCKEQKKKKPTFEKVPEPELNESKLKAPILQWVQWESTGPTQNLHLVLG